MTPPWGTLALEPSRLLRETSDFGTLHIWYWKFMTWIFGVQRLSQKKLEHDFWIFWFRTFHAIYEHFKQKLPISQKQRVIRKKGWLRKVYHCGATTALYLVPLVRNSLPGICAQNFKINPRLWVIKKHWQMILLSIMLWI